MTFMILWRLAVYPALGLIIFSLVLFWMYARPPRYTGTLTPDRFGMNYEAVKLETADGIELDGWFVPGPEGAPALIICHGYPMDKSDLLGLTSFLAENHSLLYFDFRAMGRSEGFFSTGGRRETMDIEAAAGFLKDRGYGGRIGGFGFSMGASALLLSVNKELKALVLDSPYADLRGTLDKALTPLGPLRTPLLMLMRGWGLLLTGGDLNRVKPAAAAAGIRAPVLLIQGTEDSQIPSDSAADIKAACPQAELWLVEGAEHGGTKAEAGAEYNRRVSDFFAAAFGRTDS